MGKRFNLVRCKKCNRIIGADYEIKNIERCYRCHKGISKRKFKQTESSIFARVKKGPAPDLGELGKLNFRSPWERNFARWLTINKVNWTFERVSFTFSNNPLSNKPYARRPYIYIPDFYDVDSGTIYEVKGYFRSEDRSKIKRLKANYPKEIKKLVAVISKGNKKAFSFYSKYNIKVLFIENIKNEYRKLTKDGIWE
jgi:hypothetical protein